MDKGCRFYYRCLYSMDICKNDPKLAEEEKVIMYHVSYILKRFNLLFLDISMIIIIISDFMA